MTAYKLDSLKLKLNMFHNMDITSGKTQFVRYPHMFGCPLYVWMPPYIWTPLYVWTPPYVWMQPVCLDALICLDAPTVCLDVPMIGHP